MQFHLLSQSRPILKSLSFLKDRFQTYPYLYTKMILTSNNLGITVNKSVYFSEPEILSI